MSGAEVGPAIWSQSEDGSSAPRVATLPAREPQGEGMEAIRGLQRRLHAAETPEELLARACVEACAYCGFERGLILSVEDGWLLATGLATIPDAGCDKLRRQVLSHPVPLLPASEEALAIQHAEGSGRRCRPTSSPLRDALALEHYALCAIAPDGHAIALLVLDRAAPAVDEGSVAATQLFSHLLALALERIVLRSRLADLAREVRHLTASANALMQETMDAPIGLPSSAGYARVLSIGDAVRGPNHEPLTPRERQIAKLLVAGRSNREIGNALYLSSETVKAHVARLLRKLGAANRVEAAAYLVRDEEREAS